MRRTIQNLIEDPLAEGLLHGRFKPGDIITVDRQGEDLVLESKPGLVEAQPEPESTESEKIVAETA